MSIPCRLCRRISSGIARLSGDQLADELRTVCEWSFKTPKQGGAVITIKWIKTEKVKSILARPPPWIEENRRHPDIVMQSGFKGASAEVRVKSRSVSQENDCLGQESGYAIAHCFD